LSGVQVGFSVKYDLKTAIRKVNSQMYMIYNYSFCLYNLNFL